MAGVLSNAISGLQASQIGLRTAGNNISNANTVGYSRQNVNFDTRVEQRYGSAGFLGNGVNVESVKRVVNDFVTSQLRLDSSTFHQLDKYNTSIGKIDKLLSDTNTGLVGGLQNFFAALQNGANDPSSSSARQLVVAQSESLASRFNNLHERLNAIEKGVNDEISTVTGQLTQLAKSVATLNLAVATQRAAGAEPNSLLDQREEAIRKLSELVSVQLVHEDDGDINVFVGNGEALVVGTNVSKFEVRNGGKIYLANNLNSSEITNDISGGQLGGLLNFKNEALASSFNQLGRVAIVMSDSFNTLQAQGLDINGNYGNPMFSDMNDLDVVYNRVKHGQNALPDNRQLYVTIEDANKLTASDYNFSIVPNSSNYTITRAADNTIVDQGVLSGAYPTEITFDGISLHLQSGSFQGGDSFILQPTRNAARELESVIAQPENLAFAVPIRTATASGNIGKGIISSGEILSLNDANNNLLPAFAVAGKLSPPIAIRFTSDTTYEVLDNTDPANPVALNPRMSEQTFIPNRNNAIFATDQGETTIVGSGAIIGLPAGRPPVTLLAANPMQLNGYPAETYTFTTTNPITGNVSTQTMATTANLSAAQTAAQISNMTGVSAHAFTTATIGNVNINPAAFASPLQLSVNGEDLLAYTAGVLDAAVPNPNVSPGNFNDYLAARINANGNLNTLGIRAESGSNPVTGAPELHLVAASGVNLDIRFNATNASVNSISVNDGSGNPDVQLNGVNTGLNEQSATTVGGKIDITLADGIIMSTAPGTSQLLGDSTAVNFAQSSYLGYQVNISGQPKAGDIFNINFNTNSKNDNRNALALANLETAATMDGSLSFGQGYGRLVEELGTKSNLSKINTEASKSLLEQTKALRDGVSGVNLDEEAANLILFQQMYTANARVITVAKDLFDTLVNSLG
ncbi:MAG: flagellar hook-associated protein FlgK [Pseudomonadota bacterium]